MTLRHITLSKTIGRILRIVLGSILLAGWVTHSSADDIEIYEHGTCIVSNDKYRFIFIVDNSGSMDSTDFANSRTTINAAIDYVLSSGLPDIQVAVVQYGTVKTDLATLATHHYEITVPFTEDVATATNWNRSYGPGGNVDVNAVQDHQPASLAEMRRDNVYAPGGALDITDGTNVQFVFFTDAVGARQSCCSSLKHEIEPGTEVGKVALRLDIPNYVLDDYGEYDLLKDGSVLPGGIEAQFTLLHARKGTDNTKIGAAVASVGGQWTDEVDTNPTDPDGSGVKPRRYILGDLDASSDTQAIVSLLGMVIGEITTSAVLATPSVSTSASNRARHRDTLYYSLFGPNNQRNWEGNVKSYRIDSSGELVDALGQPPIDAATGAFNATSQSFWSLGPDGSDVGSGGFASRLQFHRNWYTDAGGVLRLKPNPTDIDLSEFGPGVTGLQRANVVYWGWGFDVFDTDEDGATFDTDNYVGDALHGAPLLVTLGVDSTGSTTTSDDVLFHATNFGRLHAINPETGNEFWSYTPRELLPNMLSALELRADVDDHNYGLDGQLVFYASDVDTTASTTTVEEGYLYMSQRRGGQGLFALEVSNALRATDPFRVAWKIQGGTGEFEDLGQTWATPVIASVQTNCATSCVKRDVLIVSGGYNPAYDAPNYTLPTPAPTGHGNAIYFIDPETGDRLWSMGYSASHDLQLNGMRDSVPAQPVVVDTDGDGGIDVMIFSDIAGKVWRVDFDENASSLGELHLAGGQIADLSTRSNGTARFFNSPDVAVLDGSATSYFNISLGSGARNRPLTDEPDTNAIYFLRDPFVYENPTVIDPVSGDRIPEYRYVDRGGGTLDIIQFGDLSPVGIPSGIVTHGLYSDMPDAGEKILSPTLTFNGKVLLLSYVPPGIITVDTGCSFSLGTTRLRVFDLADAAFEPIPANGEMSIDVVAGIASQPQLASVGNGSGLQLVTGLAINKVDSLIDVDTETMRRIIGTSWSEAEYKK